MTVESKEMLSPYPVFPERLPKEEVESGQYAVRFARTEQELEEVLRLRYQVFNVEMDEGLDESYLSGRDIDHYDSGCHHMIIIHKGSGLIIGTYRLQTRAMANAHAGFYSENEFKMDMLPSTILEQSVELGRACIHLDHRNGRVLFLLWRGLINYLKLNEKRYFFGCCSITSQDPEEGKRVMDHLSEEGFVHSEYYLEPQPRYTCYPDSLVVRAQGKVKIPRLMRMYLSYNVKVCGPPAIDRDFKTIDYFVLWDLESVSEETHKLLFR